MSIEILNTCVINPESDKLTKSIIDNIKDYKWNEFNLFSQLSMMLSDKFNQSNNIDGLIVFEEILSKAIANRIEKTSVVDKNDPKSFYNSNQRCEYLTIYIKLLESLSIIMNNAQNTYKYDNDKVLTDYNEYKENFQSEPAVTCIIFDTKNQDEDKIQAFIKKFQVFYKSISDKTDKKIILDTYKNFCNEEFKNIKFIEKDVSKLWVNVVTGLSELELFNPINAKDHMILAIENTTTKPEDVYEFLMTTYHSKLIHDRCKELLFELFDEGVKTLVEVEIPSLQKKVNVDSHDFKVLTSEIKESINKFFKDLTM